MIDRNDSVLRRDEAATLALRALYRQYGYLPYRMSKFEEYDLYAANKSFLTSESILTFRDGDGRLMALRPDVTLSIIRSYRGGANQVEKLCYDENVYRPSGETRDIREIRQSGLECIGALDAYLVGEVVMLAAHSLAVAGGRGLLDLSHMGFAEGMLDGLQLSAGARDEMLGCLRAKSEGGVRAICREYGIDGDRTARLAAMASLCGPYTEARREAASIACGEKCEEALRCLDRVFETVRCFDDGCAEMLRLDFSVVNDMRYYSGVIFQGFAEGIPFRILSGGSYDRLMARFGKPVAAMGFAVSLDHLGRESGEGEPTFDCLLRYPDGTEAAQVASALRKLTARGWSVRAERQGADTSALRCGRELTLEEVLRDE